MCILIRSTTLLAYWILGRRRESASAARSSKIGKRWVGSKASLRAGWKKLRLTIKIRKVMTLCVWKRSSHLSPDRRTSAEIPLSRFSWMKLRTCNITNHRIPIRSRMSQIKKKASNSKVPIMRKSQEQSILLQLITYSRWQRPISKMLILSHRIRPSMYQRGQVPATLIKLVNPKKALTTIC